MVSSNSIRSYGRKNMVKIVIENDSNDDHMEEANAAAEDYSSSGVVRGN